MTAASTPNVSTYLWLHRALRASARRLAEVTATTSSERPGPRSRRDDKALIQWCDGFIGEIRCHHRTEDLLLFPALRDRIAIYGEFAARLAEDHTSLEAMLDELSAALRARDRVRTSELAVQLRDHLDGHLAFEEDEIVPLFVRHFTGDEFAQLDQRAIKMTPPRQLVFTAPWMLSHLTSDERTQLLASVPKAMTILWMLTRRRYSRLAARALPESMC